MGNEYVNFSLFVVVKNRDVVSYPLRSLLWLFGFFLLSLNLLIRMLCRILPDHRHGLIDEYSLHLLRKLLKADPLWPLSDLLEACDEWLPFLSVAIAITG